MTNALNKTNAAARAQGPRLARLARRGLAVCMLACVGLGAAHAQGHGRRDDAQLPPPPSARGDRFPAPQPQIDQLREQRGYDQMRDPMREQMREQQRAMDDQQRRQMQEQNGRDSRREGRLTPDERRDLRRQINEAGADIYPNARRR